MCQQPDIDPSRMALKFQVLDLKTHSGCIVPIENPGRALIVRDGGDWWSLLVSFLDKLHIPRRRLDLPSRENDWIDG